MGKGCCVNHTLVRLLKASKQKCRAPEETFGDDGYGHCLVCGDGFTGAYMCHNLSNYILQTCAVYCMSIISQ